MHQAVLRLEARHFQRQQSHLQSSGHGAFDVAEMRQRRWMMREMRMRQEMEVDMMEDHFELATRMQRQQAMEVDEEAVTQQVAVIRQAFANVLSESRVPVSLDTADELEQRIDRARDVYGEYEALVTETRQASALRNALQEMVPVDQDFDLRVQVIGCWQTKWHS